MSRILKNNIATVRERIRLDDIVGETVTLRASGAHTLKGLCPFHDEKSPSFQVDPQKGFWHCFGCSQGGDVIDFVQKIDNLSFAEAVEKLADKLQYTLTYEDLGSTEASEYARKRVLYKVMEEAHQYYRDMFTQLPTQHPAKLFLTERKFGVEDTKFFQLGYAPQEWNGLTTRLTAAGYTVEDLVDAGLTVERDTRFYDRFRNRLLWPITSPTGKTVGFGGRKLGNDDKGPKYLNSPETLLYHKSHVLYHLNEARKHVTNENRVVIVEGYTDVMAFHAAGIRTAIATCGTAFGPDHVSVLRRAIGDDGSFNGDVIFTFDGDTAGRAAAIKSFNLDARFTRHTAIAATVNGLDPCDVRLRDGNTGLKKMLENKTPLFEYVLTTTLAEHDLTTGEGRSTALDAAAPILSQIRDDVLRNNYDRWVANRLGMDAWKVSRHVRLHGNTTTTRIHATTVDENVETSLEDDASSDTFGNLTPGSDRWVERESLKCAIQHPWFVRDWYASVDATAYTTPQHKKVHHLLTQSFPQSPKVDDPPDRMKIWLDTINAEADPNIGRLLALLTLEPVTLDTNFEKVEQHCRETLVKLLDIDARRMVEGAKAQLAGLDPTAPEFAKLYKWLISLEGYRKILRSNEYLGI